MLANATTQSYHTINVTNQYAVYLKLRMFYVHYISIKLKELMGFAWVPQVVSWDSDPELTSRAPGQLEETAQRAK